MKKGQLWDRCTTCRKTIARTVRSIKLEGYVYCLKCGVPSELPDSKPIEDPSRVFARIRFRTATAGRPENNYRNGSRKKKAQRSTDGPSPFTHRRRASYRTGRVP